MEQVRENSDKLEKSATKLEKTMYRILLDQSNCFKHGLQNTQIPKEKQRHQVTKAGQANIRGL